MSRMPGPACHAVQDLSKASAPGSFLAASLIKEAAKPLDVPSPVTPQPAGAAGGAPATLSGGEAGAASSQTNRELDAAATSSAAAAAAAGSGPSGEGRAKRPGLNSEFKWRCGPPVAEVTTVLRGTMRAHCQDGCRTYWLAFALPRVAQQKACAAPCVQGCPPAPGARAQFLAACGWRELTGAVPWTELATSYGLRPALERRDGGSNGVYLTAARA
jgi:hypothetical protein